jgi:plasmid stabilization system protein ParE
VKIRYTPRAINDIIAIADYLIERSPAGARAVETAIRRTVDLLGEFSGSGRVLTQRSHVRVMPVARYPYLVFYKVNIEDLLILHVRHGARAPVKDEDF